MNRSDILAKAFGVFENWQRDNLRLHLEMRTGILCGMDCYYFVKNGKYAVEVLACTDSPWLFDGEMVPTCWINTFMRMCQSGAHEEPASQGWMDIKETLCDYTRAIRTASESSIRRAIRNAIGASD